MAMTSARHIDCAPGHGSGAIGLAGMSASRPLDGVRLLRPLLSVAKAELVALLEARGQDWISDPSNGQPAFERVRLRASAVPEAEAREAAALHRLGLERRRLEAEAARLLVRSLVVHEAGWADIDAEDFDMGPSGGLAFGALFAVSRAAPTTQPRGPPQEALARIRGEEAADFTLGGCHLRRRGSRLEVHRDWGAIRHR
jgi:tRNA(Ile)-lysidine synthase